MGSILFSRAAALELIANRVDTGIEVTSMRIQGLAKSLAPVRKTVKRGGRNRSAPEPVGFYRRFDGKRIDTTTALGLIGQALHKPISGNKVADLINMGDTRTVTNWRREPNMTGNPDTVRIAALRAAMAKAGLVTRIARRNRASLSAATKGEVARLHGVRIEFEGNVARATIGGTLRRSIAATDVQRSGKKIRATVRASAPYAKYVEFPTSRTKAQPFLLPAFKAFGTAQKLGAEIKKVGG